MKTKVLLCILTCISFLTNAQIQEYNNVLIGTDAPSLGVNIKTAFPNYTGGWWRGFSISNQNNSSSLMIFGGYGTSINGISQLKYGFIGTDCVSPFISFLPNGNVGIGTTTPYYPLSVNGDIAVGVDNEVTSGYGNTLNFLGAAHNTDALWLARYNNGNNNSELRVNIGDDFGSSSDKFHIGVTHWDRGIWKSIFVAQANGFIGIGTENPTNKLDVNGTIRAKEVKVESSWADFVFKPDYQLRPLTEVEQFIKTNGHLPEIPTEKEVTQNGVSLGEMNAKLLQKVEELTLYLIEKDKKIKELETKVLNFNTVQQQLNEIKNQLNILKQAQNE